MSENIDLIIEKLLAVKDEKEGTSAELLDSEIMYLITTVTEIFTSQDVLLQLQAPLTICGDVHGQFHDLLRIFLIGGYPPQTNYLFLGDFVDRGHQSIETICLLFAFKIKYPNNFFMLRGNHECFYINRVYGFYDECIKNYNITIWRAFNNVFTYLPISAIIDDKIFCIHGGISPDLTSLQNIRDLQRPQEVPESGLLCDLLWSDPNPDPDAEPWEDNERGTSYKYSSSPVKRFLRENKFDLICRAHQAVMEGYEFPFPDSSVLTLFSAPNYCYEFQNKGAILKVDQNLYCTFAVLEPVNWEIDLYPNERPGTPPRVCVTDSEMTDPNFQLK